MPPRQPLKLTPRTRAKRPVAKKSAENPSTSLPLAPSSSAPSAATQTQSKSKILNNFSLYPDLAMAITMLEKRRHQVSPDRAELIDKWLVSLKKVQKEMTYVRKLEELSQNLAVAE